MTPARRRRGVSLVESLVAAAVLAVSMAALLTFFNQQPRAVAIDEGKQLAAMALRELRSAFGQRTFESLQALGFPAPPAAGAGDSFNALHRTRLEDHPLLTFPGLPDEEPEARRVFARRLERLGARRAVYFQVEAGPGGKQVGTVTFRVYYQVRGVERFVESHEVVLERLLRR